MINVTLNNNKPSHNIITLVNISTDGIVLYQYRNAAIQDDGTRIICTAGQDVGVIQLTVFCKY